MANTSINNESKYNLRSKFLELIKKAQLPVNYFDKVFDTSLYMPEALLLEKLWCMSFFETQHIGLNFFGVFIGNNVYSPMRTIHIKQEMVIPLRNEIRWQFTTNKNCYFLSPNFHGNEELEESYGYFLKEMAMDKIISMKIVLLVLQFLSVNLNKNDETKIIDKTIVLLKSNKDNNRYGGMKNLGLANYAINALIGKSSAIAELLVQFKNNCDDIEPNSIFTCKRVDVDKEIHVNTPLSNLSQLLDDNKIQLEGEKEMTSIEIEKKEFGMKLDQLISDSSTDEYENENTSYDEAFQDAILSNSSKGQDAILNNSSKGQVQAPVCSTKKITPEEIVKNACSFEDFFSVVTEIQNLGFDPISVLEKQKSICKFLDCYWEFMEEIGQ